MRYATKTKLLSGTALLAAGFLSSAVIGTGRYDCLLCQANWGPHPTIR